MVITATNVNAEKKGIACGTVLADARAIIPELEVLDDKPELAEKLLTRLAELCIRYTTIVAIDPPDGLLMDVIGCSHLWGGDALYLSDIINNLNIRGYNVRAAMADTIGAA
jgi:protein ImuB